MRALLLATIVFVAACTGAAGSTPRPTITFTGTGTEKSALQQLQGNYSVVWSLTARPADCGPILTLESPNNGAVLEVLVNESRGTTATTGTTNVYSLALDSYFVDGELNDCGPWTIALTPQ